MNSIAFLSLGLLAGSSLQQIEQSLKQTMQEQVNAGFLTEMPNLTVKTASKFKSINFFISCTDACIVHVSSH